MSQQRKRVLVGLVVALLLRLAFGLGYWIDKPLTHDEQEYVMLAQNLRAGNGLVYDDDGRQHFGRAPGYPVFMAAVLSVWDDARAIRVAQAILGALTVLVIGALAAQAWGGRAGLLALWLAALYPPLVWMPAYLLSETLYSLLILSSALVFWKALEPARGGRDRHGGANEPTKASPEREDASGSAGTGTTGGDVATRSSGFLLAGLLIGAAALARPVALPFLGLAVLLVLIRRNPRAAVGLLLGAVLVIAPWTAWKSHDAGKFVLIASEGGITFWTGNNPLAIGEGDLAANPAMKLHNQQIREQHPDLGPDQLEQIYNREAVEFITRHPLQWSWLTVKKLFYTWVPIGPSYLLHSPRFLYGTWLSYLSVLPFALLGWWTLARRRRPQPWVMWLLIGSVLAINLVFFPQERFRVPVLDPMLLVGAAVWLQGAPWLAHSKLGTWLLGSKEDRLAPPVLDRRPAPGAALSPASQEDQAPPGG
jgi:4-amino-4-deoxy-L-arabinose transferase-like glycosyltransferase